MSETVDPWFQQVLKSVQATAPPPGAVSILNALEPSTVRQQSLADLYDDWADSVPAENRVEFLKLSNRLRQLTHDTNDPLALILYTIGTSNKIHLLLPNKIYQQCQSVVHDLDSRLDQIRGLHNQAVDKLTQAQLKLSSEYTALCELTSLRFKDTLQIHLQSIEERGRNLHTTLDQQSTQLKELQTTLVDAVSHLLVKPVEQSNNNQALLKHLHQVVARIDVLFHKTYLTVIWTFVGFIVGAFVAGILLRPYL